MTQWTCPDCGLVHQHDKHLHTLWNVDGLDWDWIKHKMDYNEACNCGALEAKVALEEGELLSYTTEEARRTIEQFEPSVPQQSRSLIEDAKRQA